jgi:UDP-glucuronate decarboxylase
VLQLAKLVIERTKSKSKIVFKPLPSDDPKQRQPDLTLARDVLKWEPSIQLAEGLDKTIKYFRTKLKGR